MLELKQNVIDAIQKLSLEWKVASNAKKYRMVISKQIEDRSGDIIMLAGCKYENYMKNPVVLQDHSYEVSDIIGKTISLENTGTELIAEFVFASTEKAKLAEELYNWGFLKASSIWFRRLASMNDNRRIITEFELVEWSLVAVPCNPGALSLDWKTLEKALEYWLILKNEEDEGNKSELAEIKKELAEMKALLKTLVDGKTESKKMEEESEEILRKKELLQAIARGTNQALEAIKKL